MISWEFFDPPQERVFGWEFFGVPKEGVFGHVGCVGIESVVGVWGWGCGLWGYCFCGRGLLINLFFVWVLFLW